MHDGQGLGGKIAQQTSKAKITGGNAKYHLLGADRNGRHVADNRLFDFPVMDSAMGGADAFTLRMKRRPLRRSPRKRMLFEELHVSTRPNPNCDAELPGKDGEEQEEESCDEVWRKQTIQKLGMVLRAQMDAGRQRNSLLLLVWPGCKREKFHREERMKVRRTNANHLKSTCATMDNHPEVKKCTKR